jgi:hypothetical protein
LLAFIFDTTGMREMVSARDIVSSIISAANRKIQRRRKGQDEVDNEEHDDDDKVRYTRSFYSFALMCVDSN